MRKKRRLSRRYALAGIIVLVPILSPTPAEAGSPPSLEAKAWLYEAKDTYTRTDDDTLSPAGSDSTGFYWENNIDATGGSANPARLNSNDPIWDVYSDGSTLYRLVFQLQADTTDLEYSCSVENDGYWYVDNSDGYWVYTDAAGTKELLSREKVANQDVADTSGVGSTNEDYRIAQSFVAEGDVMGVQLFGRKAASALSSASAILRIETDNSGEPSGTLVSSAALDTLSASSFSTSHGWVAFTFDSTIPLQADTAYHIVFKDNNDNIPVSLATDNQRHPAIVSDGYRGAIITWQDDRSGNCDIYAQRVDSLGDTLWTADGVAICGATNNQEYPTIASDDCHGAIITWQDKRGGPKYDIYAQRVDSSGTVKWTADGVAICQATDNQEYPTIVSDDCHGAIITWQDKRGGPKYDIYAQRVDSSGTVKWTADGVAICQATDNQQYPTIVSDGYHRAIITWQDYRSGNSDIYAQRVDSLGDTLWTADGVAICQATNNQEYPTMVSDGYHGAIITWHDKRGGPKCDIYAQRVDSLGDTLWTADGVAICEATNYSEYPNMVSDGYHGAIITWQDYRSGTDYDIYAQRVDSSGTVKWTADGVAVCQATDNQQYPTIVSDDHHGAIITWQDPRTAGSKDIYAQRVDSSGTVKWTADGAAVCLIPNDQANPMIVSDDHHGAIITWQDYRSGTDYDIYGQRVDSLGNVKWGGYFEWAYEASDYGDGEMLERSPGTDSWTHHDTLDLFFKFPAWLITDYESGWWSDPKNIDHTYAPDISNDITGIDTDNRLECVDATRNWLGDAYDGEDILYADTDSTLIWEVNFQVDEDWTDDDTINLHLYIYKAGGGYTTDIAFKLRTTSPKLKWSYPSMDNSPLSFGIVTGPAIRESRVYVTCQDDKLYCLDASDGSLIWDFTSANPIRTSPAAVYEDPNWTFYFANDGGYVYAITDTGDSYEEKWTTLLTGGQSIRSSPAVMDSLLYVGCWDDSIHCLRTSDGSRKWGTYISGVSNSSPAVYNNVVYAGSYSDTLYAVNASDGTILRRYGACGNIIAPVYMTWTDGRICIGSYASETAGYDTMYVINSSNFSDYWKFADSGNLARMETSCFSLDDVNVYFGSDNDYLYCVDISDSSLVYKYQTGGYVKSSPLCWNGVVYFGSDDDKFYALDNSTEQLKSGWPFYSNGDVQSSPAISLDDNIVVIGSSDGRVYAFDLE